MTSAPSAPAIRVAAPAKLNLYLHVLGRRADGYHRLDSLVVFARVHDTIAVRPAERLSLAVSGPFGAALAGEDDNLALRAARLLAETAGVKEGAEIRLVKRLPVAAGIGGGSADAAAALKALTRLWRLDLGQTELLDLALRLGADVPVCLYGRAAFVGGAGEEITPAPTLPEVSAVLVNPARPLATADVFAARRGPYSRPLLIAGRIAGRIAGAVADVTGLAAQLAPLRNDLTDGAAGLVPEIGAVLEALAAQPGCLLARLSGSGPTCFGLFSDETAAGRAAAAMAAAQPEWWALATRLMADAAADAADD